MKPGKHYTSTLEKGRGGKIKQLIRKIKRIFTKEKTKRGVFILKQNGFSYPTTLYLSYRESELKALEKLLKRSRIEMSKK